LRIIPILVLAAILGLYAGETAACGLSDLAWMAGSWRDSGGASSSEERWIVGPDGILIGSSWVMSPGKPPFIEAMTISSDENGISLRLRHFSRNLTHAMEERDAPMLFILKSCADESVLFDGTGPQAREHITYHRFQSNLEFIGDFVHDDKPVTVRIILQRAGD